ncbi:tyrosine-type recombinase/integrase [Paraburkholderia sp. A3RO-2L]|uniref:tyrosine-type recombinase/integrase n=1 Tax=unclassified Paraburkholderia TaxID=2615204 RepID=UPI0032F54674|nr:tyrosine-type recombinase/integrase [Burkholderia vietnamiensis]
MSLLSPQLSLTVPPPSTPAPLEQLLLPPALSGVRGANRATKSGQLAATDDLAAVTAWLARYADTPATLAAYRREIERLLLWAVIELGKPLSSLTHEDLLIYDRFLRNPQPAERWVLRGSGKRLARSHAGWRPFAGPLSEVSVRHALVILNACFAWLTEAGYLAGNPLSLARHRRAKVKPRITRYLDHETWALVKATIEAMPIDTERERQHAARCRWVFTVLYLGGLRAAEMTGTTMGAFFSRRDSKGKERWWLEVAGKGDKTRLVPATEELMLELKRYRAANGLPELPQAGEAVPLVLPVIGAAKPLSRGALHLVVKEVFNRTAQRVRAREPDGEALASVLENASAHWLRHTAGSHMSDQQVDLRHVRDTFGHSSIATTSGYLHTEDDARHEAIQERHHIDWSEAL